MKWISSIWPVFGLRSFIQHCHWMDICSFQFNVKFSFIFFILAWPHFLFLIFGNTQNYIQTNILWTVQGNRIPYSGNESIKSKMTAKWMKQNKMKNKNRNKKQRTASEDEEKKDVRSPDKKERKLEFLFVSSLNRKLSSICQVGVVCCPSLELGKSSQFHSPSISRYHFVLLFHHYHLSHWQLFEFSMLVRRFPLFCSCRVPNQSEPPTSGNNEDTKRIDINNVPSVYS